MARALVAAVAARENGSKVASEDVELCAWSRALDPKIDVQGTTAWVAARLLGLPVKDDSFDPQRYVLPQRIGFLTMRSLSPDRENFDAMDDGIAV